MKWNKLYVLISACIAAFSVAAQTPGDYKLLLKSGSFVPEKNISASHNRAFRMHASNVGSRTFVVIQFEKIPTESDKLKLKESGIELLEYIPNFAYTATVKNNFNTDALIKAGSRAVIELSASQKMQPALANGEFPAHAIKRPGTTDVWVNYPATIRYEEVKDGLRAANFEILSDLYKNYQVLSLRVATDRLEQLAMLPFIQYVQAAPPEDKGFNYKSTANARANILGSSLPGGRNLLGEGVVVGVGDEANPMQHIDFSSRVINRTAAEAGAHGVHIMGILGGAGIVSERFAGYAPKAKMVAQNYSSILAYSPLYVRDFGMVITNNSYGGNANSCETFGVYDLYAHILDKQAFEMPYLQHVFAAGNSGNTACSPFPTGFANVLSGYQTAKNVISVGNTSETGVIASGSSAGPVRDGRIKPEITAQGTSVTSTIPVNLYTEGSGTSMSSPAVAGGLALLYQRFRQLNANRDPKNALMKALICNGGTDKGNEGPDYKYGFGWLNLNRSLKMLEDRNYKNDSVSQGTTKTFTIHIPANTASLKVMLYWNDPAAAVLSSQNLVHDLDLSVTNSSASFLPALLDPTPANVNMTAGTGVDNINNMEQVVIKNPVEGTYTISVTGRSVVQNPRQEYFVVYDVIPLSLRLTHPIGNERFKDGDIIQVHWDAFGNTGSTFTVQQSLDNGVKWDNIAVNLLPGTSRINWTIPAKTVTDKAKIRVLQNSTGEQSASEVFTILGVPVVSLAASQCEGYIALGWQAITGATDYEVMLLKGDEMVGVGTTTSLNYVLSGLSKDSLYYLSVRARLNGHPGRRSVAISRKPDSGSCSGSISDHDIAIDAIIAPANSGRKNTSTALSGQMFIKAGIRNLDDVDSNGPFTIGYSINGVSRPLQTVSPLIEKGKIYEHTFSTAEDFSAPGNYNLKVFIHSQNDPVAANDTITKTFSQLENTAVVLPFLDDMEAIPEQTVTNIQNGLAGGARYTFTPVTAAGRLRTFFNSGMASSGNKALTLDVSQYFEEGNINYLDATFNLSGYDVASSDVRFNFKYKNHGQKSNAGNKVWIRGKDTDPWIQVYDLFANQNQAEEGYKLSPVLELSNVLSANSKNFSSSFQIRFGQWGKFITADYSNGAGYSFDDISIFTVENDVQLLGIVQPLTENCGLGNAESIIVRIKNSSGADITNVPVSYQLGNGPVITETIPSMLKRSTIQYSFVKKANLSAIGEQKLKVWLSFEGDTYNENDSLHIEFYNSPVYSSFPYLENFEVNDGFWYAKGRYNSWEHGKPLSAQIRSAASGSKIWKTNLSGSHNDFEESYLYSPCFDVSGLDAPMLSLSLALDLEVCDAEFCDYAAVEYSGNGGPWTQLGTEGAGTNWYDRTIDSRSAWNVEDYMQWHVATVPLPTGFANLKLRFVMRTDGSVRRGGIAIDDIHIYDKNYGIYDGASMVSPVSQAVPAAQNWVDFLQDGKLIASVNSNMQNMGNTLAQAYVKTTGVGSANGAYYLGRNFTIKPTNIALTDSVSIRLYFLETEVQAWQQAAGCSHCEKPSIAYALGVSKYSDADKSKEDGNLANSTNGTWQHIPAQGVTVVPFDKGYYAEFKVRDFSEFWLAEQFVGTKPALPVELISFAARKKTGDGVGEDVFLEWETASEENFHHFDIELVKGTEAFRQNQFARIGAIMGAADLNINRKYTFTDKEAGKTGVRYYRLKMVDADSSFRYSVVRPVFFNERITRDVYPNPSPGVFYITHRADAGREVLINVYDRSGRRYPGSRFWSTGFVQKHKMDLSAKEFGSGLYLFELISGQEKQIFKVIKD